MKVLVYFKNKIENKIEHNKDSSSLKKIYTFQLTKFLKTFTSHLCDFCHFFHSLYLNFFQFFILNKSSGFKDSSKSHWLRICQTNNNSSYKLYDIVQLVCCLGLTMWRKGRAMMTMVRKISTTILTKLRLQHKHNNSFGEIWNILY